MQIGRTSHPFAARGRRKSPGDPLQENRILIQLRNCFVARETAVFFDTEAAHAVVHAHPHLRRVQVHPVEFPRLWEIPFGGIPQGKDKGSVAHRFSEPGSSLPEAGKGKK